MSETQANPMLQFLGFVLAVIGGLAVLAAAAMALMHTSMFGGFGC